MSDGTNTVAVPADLAVTAVNDTPSAAAASPISTDGLLAYYKFDENSGSVAFDGSGFERDGTLTGSASFSHDKPHVINDRSVMSVPSVDSDSVTVSNGDGVFDFPGSFTVATWVKVPVDGDAIIIGTRTSCGDLGWEIGRSAGQLYYTVPGFTRFSNFTSLGNGWTHIAITFDEPSGTTAMYLNGVTDSIFFFPQPVAVEMPLTIGHGDCAGADVLLDELQIYSRVLDSGEVATLGALPQVPQDLGATIISSTMTRLDWTGVSGATRYLIYRGTGVGDETYFTSTGPVPSFTYGHLAADTLYSWRVAAGVDPLYSDPSNTALGRTFPVLDAPLEVTATPTASDRIRIDWDTVPGASFYRVYQSTSVDGPFLFLGTVRAPALTFRAAGLALRTHYWYTVTALDLSLVPSPPSALADAFTPTPLDAPLGVTATPISSSRIRIDWQRVVGASFYRVYESTTSSEGPYLFRGTVLAPTVTYRAAGLAPMTPYWYQVYTFDAKFSMQSAPSEVAGAITFAP